MKELAEQFEVNKDTIFEHVRRQGIPFRRNIYSRLSPEQIVESVRLYKSELSLRAVARTLETSADTARKVLVEAGVAIRRR